MSGLLVKSTAFMKENLNKLNEQGITIPVILGGAALTPRFVNVDCCSVYKGKVVYGKDAFTDLRFMDAYMEAKKANKWDNIDGFKNNVDSNISQLIGSTTMPNLQKSTKNDLSLETKIITTKRSQNIKEEISIEPPFKGSRIVLSEQISLDKILYYLDKNALYSGQWQLRKKKNQTREEYDQYLKEIAEPILQKWVTRIEQDKLVEPSFVYGYFPCGRIDNKLIVFDPQLNDHIMESSLFLDKDLEINYV